MPSVWEDYAKSVDTAITTDPRIPKPMQPPPSPNIIAQQDNPPGAQHGAHLASKFELRDKVYIDEDKSMVGYVTGFCWKFDGLTIEVSWMHNGAAYTAWINEWRLSIR